MGLSTETIVYTQHSFEQQWPPAISDLGSIPGAPEASVVC